MSHRRSESELLPSVSAAHQRLSTYLDRLGASPGSPPVDGASTIGPLDSLLISLYLCFRADRIAVLDLAAEPTQGASTLLAATHEGVRVVRVVRPNGVGAGTWRETLTNHLEELGTGAFCPVETIAPISAGSHRDAPDRRPLDVVFVHLGGRGRSEIAAQLDEALRLGRGGPVLILGLGATGHCPAIAELVERSSGNGPHRTFLFRELNGVLGMSGIGLLTTDPRSEALTLERIEAFFTGNFDFLRLVEDACRTAVAATMLDEPTRLKLQPGSSRRGIESERVLRLLVEANQEREELRRNVDNLLEHVWRLQQERLEQSQVLVETLLVSESMPEVVVMSPSLARRAARVWRRDGVGGVLQRLHRRVRSNARV